MGGHTNFHQLIKHSKNNYKGFRPEGPIWPLEWYTHIHQCIKPGRNTARNYCLRDLYVPWDDTTTAINASNIVTIIKRDLPLNEVSSSWFYTTTSTNALNIIIIIARNPPLRDIAFPWAYTPILINESTIVKILQGIQPLDLYLILGQTNPCLTMHQTFFKSSPLIWYNYINQCIKTSFLIV